MPRPRRESADLLGDTKCHFVHKSIHNLFSIKSASICSWSVLYVVLIPIHLDESIRAPAPLAIQSRSRLFDPIALFHVVLWVEYQVSSIESVISLHISINAWT